MTRSASTNASTTARPTHCICCQTARVASAQETAHGVDLCVRCYDEAGYENAHSDGHHTDAADENCHVCQGTDPHASIRGAAVGAGRVVRESDGRLQANAPVPAADAKRVRVVSFRGDVTHKTVGLTGSIVTAEPKTVKGDKFHLVKLDAQGQCRWYLVSELKKTTVAAPVAA